MRKITTPFLFIVFCAIVVMLFKVDVLWVAGEEKHTKVSESTNIENVLIFDYPASLDIDRVGLPSNTLALKGDSEGLIYVTYKPTIIEDRYGSIKNLTSEQYITREAAGIEGLMSVSDIKIGDYDVKKVIRNAAGENAQVLLYYIFREKKVFRISVYPFVEEGDDKVSSAERIISSAKFID